ncbi:hypothetical protein VNO78_18133 [Psophocarpus tetragonolobus]|uniref:Uncharacterized protein n=1 Tax=Psophocarpus tetragonolobus TaxID=3891 RepID=A0AAN9SHW5_PSOTE
MSMVPMGDDMIATMVGVEVATDEGVYGKWVGRVDVMVTSLCLGYETIDARVGANKSLTVESVVATVHKAPSESYIMPSSYGDQWLLRRLGHHLVVVDGMGGGETLGEAGGHREESRVMVIGDEGGQGGGSGESTEVVEVLVDFVLKVPMRRAILNRGVGGRKTKGSKRNEVLGNKGGALSKKAKEVIGVEEPTTGVKLWVGNHKDVNGVAKDM